MPQSPANLSRDELSQEVKELLRRDLKLGSDAEVADDMPLIGGEFELDSLDVVLLIGSVEKRFGVKLPRDASASEVFGSVDAIVDFLATHGGDGEESASPANAGDELSATLARLPHGEPFRFVSELVALEPGVSAEGRWELTGSEDFFRGHFPGRPMVPGVLISEALAQAAGLIAAGSLGPAAAQGVALAQVNVKVRRPVEPPATITLRARHEKTLDTLMHCSVQASVGELTVAEGELTLKLPG